MLVMKLMVEGLCLGALLVVVCVVGIRNGAVRMVHLYDKKVQDRVIQLGVTTREAIRRRGVRFRGLCIPAYMAYVLVCVYAVNGARGFLPGFWQGLVILSIMNLIDRILIDGYWVGHTDAWVIPGTEDLRPYIAAKDKQRKAHRRKAVKGGPVHLEESCEEFKRASWEVQKKYHFALPRIKGIEKLMEGAGFMIVVSRQIRGMIYTVTGEK